MTNSIQQNLNDLSTAILNTKLQTTIYKSQLKDQITRIETSDSPPNRSNRSACRSDDLTFKSNIMFHYEPEFELKLTIIGIIFKTCFWKELFLNEALSSLLLS